jgi:hypothetical protein
MNKIVAFIAFLISFGVNAKDLDSRVVIQPYHQSGTERGCAIVRSEKKFTEALNLYGWKTNGGMIPEIDWNKEVSVILTGTEMEYIGTSIEEKSDEILVKWKKRELETSTGPTTGKGGVIVWGGMDAEEQTMVVALPIKDTKGKVIICRNEKK